MFREPKTTVGHGQTYAFKLIVRNGYSETDSYAVKANGKTLVPQTDAFGAYIYTVPDVQENLVITVAGVADITPPAAELRIGTNKFHSFMHTITFGLFFRQTQTVTVTASDNGSGISRVEYLLSETAFADQDAITGNWIGLAFEDGQAKAYVYVRVTDKSGNITVVNSDGVVVYTDAETIRDTVDFTLLDKADVALDVQLNGIP